MDVEILTQPSLDTKKEFFLGDKIISLLSSKRPKFVSATFMFGFVKPNAFEKLKPYLADFLSRGGIVNFYITLDKKITSRLLLSEFLSFGCNVYVFTPKDNCTDFHYRNIIFESPKKSEILLPSGNLSLSGLYDSFATVTSLSYGSSEEDLSSFHNLKKRICPDSLMNSFTQAFIENLDDIYNKSAFIPSVDEFKRNDTSKLVSKNLLDSNILIEIAEDIDFLVPESTPVVEKKECQTVTSKSAPNSAVLNSTPLSEDIFPYSDTPVYYCTEEAVDLENMALSISKVSKPKNKDIIKHSDSIQYDSEEASPHKIIKPIDVSKTAIFMFEAPKITPKGICKGEIKIPLYLRDLIAPFWEWPQSYISKGELAKIKSRICTFKIVDTSNPGATIVDTKVKLFQREAELSFTISSKELESIDIKENDIIRLIKTQDVASSYYMCEIIRQNAKEYVIWSQFCTNAMKGSKRKYGIM